MNRNEQIIHVWNLGAVYTGLAGGMTTTLNAYTAAIQFGPIANPVTITELAPATGIYIVRYTPDGLNNYPSTWHLRVVEPVNGFESWWEDLVDDVADPLAYCSLAEVEALTQRGIYSAATVTWIYTPTTQPTDVEVRGFMVQRAGQVYSWMVPAAGAATPGPSGYAVTINTATDRGKALDGVCRKANALGAAADALFAAGSTLAPGGSELAAAYLAQFEAMRDVVVESVQVYVPGGLGGSRNHYSSGQVTKLQVPAMEEQGVVFDSRTSW